MADDTTDLRLITAQEALKASLAKFLLSSTMTEPMRPQHFVTRQNGTMVPLVALDELPATVSLRGVPRTLSPYDVAGMTGLGTIESQHRQYVVDGPRHGFQPERKATENDIFASKYATIPTNPDLASPFGGMGLHSRAASSTAHGSQPKAFGIKETRSALPSHLSHGSARSAEPANGPLTIEDLARNPAPGVKEYCSYWLRHGECDYAQQGCLYRHEMPLDPPTLEKLGLRDIPRWYREKHGLGSYLALGAQRTSSGSTRPDLMERNWRNHPDGATSDGIKPPMPAPELRNGHAKNNPMANRVNGWNVFANKHSAAYDSHVKGPLISPPASRQAFPPSTNIGRPSTARPGSRLVPANTEFVSARILREANEQLDAHEELERAALKKYAPLVPQKTGPSPTTPASAAAAAAAASNAVTPPPSEHDDDGSSAETSTSGPDVIASPAKDQTKETAPSPAMPSTTTTTVVSPAASPATAVAAGAQRKSTGGKARARARETRMSGAGAGAGAGVAVDREAQRKAVARARQQVEELAKAQAKAKGGLLVTPA